MDILNFLQTVLSFIVLIGVLVFVHELGHFLTAKWTGMRADVFALGMGPRLFGWNRRTGFTFGKLPEDLDLGDDTDWRICALPIGGYVKILGMIDESMDTEHANQPPKPYEFRSKNAAQKALVLSAGVIMNLILAVVAFFAVYHFHGTDEPMTTTVSYVGRSSPWYQQGMRDGDRVLLMNGIPVRTWTEVLEPIEQLGSDDRLAVQVRHADGTDAMVFVKGSDVGRYLAQQRHLGIAPTNMKIHLDVLASTPAQRAGLLDGDTLLAIDDMPVRATMQMTNYVKSHPSDTLMFHVERGDSTLMIPVVVGKNGTVGVKQSPVYTGPMQHRSYSIGEAFAAGYRRTVSTIGQIGSSIAMVFSGDVPVSESFGGPVQIAKMAAQSAGMGWHVFIGFMGLISISLALMNILPVPGLDGGHLVFVLVEAVIRRELPTNVKIRIQQVGMVLLLCLMAFVLYLDFTR